MSEGGSGGVRVSKSGSGNRAGRKEREGSTLCNGALAFGCGRRF